jgi:hypothetical protein
LTFDRWAANLAGMATHTDDAALLQGELHLYVAFDWGDEIDLGRAQQLVPATLHVLPRRPRTPSSIGYHPAPLRFELAKVPLEIAGLGVVQATAEATVFDFAAASVALHVPFTLTAEKLRALAGELVHLEQVVEAARRAVEPLHRQLEPAILRPARSDLTEEYVVFELAPHAQLGVAERLPEERGEWLAGVVRLEAGTLSAEEVREALRQRLSYSPDDLLVVEWAAAILVDRDGEETLQVIEFANLQLLEFREIDQRLDRELLQAYDLIHPLARTKLPYWRFHSGPLRQLGDLRIEANVVFERTSNALKLVGDQYLARLYRLLSSRFHLEEWSRGIEHSIDAVEGAYQVLADQGAMYRTELLEIIIIVLILFEIAMSLWGH